MFFDRWIHERGRWGASSSDITCFRMSIHISNFLCSLILAGLPPPHCLRSGFFLYFFRGYTRGITCFVLASFVLHHLPGRARAAHCASKALYVFTYMKLLGAHDSVSRALFPALSQDFLKVFLHALIDSSRRVDMWR